MAAKTFTDFKEDFRLEYGRLPTLEETWKAAKCTEALKPSHNTPSKEIIRLLNSISEDSRMDIFAEFCTECGSNNPRCQCWNDE